MSTSSTMNTMAKLIAAIDKLICTVWKFAFWRRKACVCTAMRVLYKAGQDSEVRTAITSVRGAHYVMAAIDSNAAKLKSFAHGYGSLDSTLKKMLVKARAAAIAHKAVMENWRS